MRARGGVISLLLLLVGLALGLLAGGCGSEQGGQLTVVVSIPPLESFVRALIGSRAEVGAGVGMGVGVGEVEIVLLVPPGTTPHTFEPKPSDVQALARARLLVLVGLGLEEPWAGELVRSAGNPELKVVELAAGIEPIGDPPNPHVWLSPRRALTMVENLKEALIEIDPAHRADYERNARVYLKRLAELDRLYREELEGLPDKRFIATRPTWVYLAQDYGLVQVEVIAGPPGEEPTPGRLRRIIQLIETEGVPLLIALVQAPERFAELIAEETGVRLVRLDPLGVEHSDYLELMRANLKKLVEGFRGRGEGSEGPG